MIEQQTTTPAEGIAALQAQIDALDDAIGQSAGTWRDMAGDPARAAGAATRLGDLERQREILRAALTEAQRALDAEAASDASDDFEARAAAAGERLLPLIEQRIELGTQLQVAVDQVADLILAMQDKGSEIRSACNREVAAVSGISEADLRSVNSEDWQYVITQVLARRLGPRLWDEECPPSSDGIRIDTRAEREVEPLRHAFERGVAERRKQIGG